MSTGASDLGDPELTRQLAEAGGAPRGSVAAAVVDVGSEPWVRHAFLGAGAIDRRFEVGSVTKGLTGMLLADAIGRGEVELDTTVGAILPSADGSPLGEVTLRELATHTSGLPRLPVGLSMTWRALRSGWLGLDPYRGLTPERMLGDAARQRLDRSGRQLYSNLGGAVCGQSVARAAGGLEFGELLHQRILLPAGMTNTFVTARGQMAPAGRSPRGFWRQPWIMDGYAPAGGLTSTIADMAHLAAGLLSGEVPGCESLLPIDGADTAERRHGMFWIVQRMSQAGPRVVWHNGQTGGYSAFFALVPDAGRAVIVLSDVAQAAQTERLAIALLDGSGKP